MTDLHKLLPCPFCGSQPDVEPWHGGPRTKVMVSCVDETCAVGPHCTGNTAAVATIKWNRRAALAEPQEQNVAHHDDECICHGNWRAIVKESLPLLGKRFSDDKGNEYSFFGIVHGDDDYYYGMSSVPGNKVMLLSCVCEIAGHGYKLIDNGEQIVAPQVPAQSCLHPNCACAIKCDEWSAVCNCHPEDYPPVPCQHKRSYSECMRAALASAQAEIAALKRPGYVASALAAEIDALYERATKEATTGDSLMFNNIAMPNNAITELKWKLVKDWPKIRQSLLRPGYVSVPVENARLSNDELAEAIETAFQLTQRTVTFQAPYKPSVEHYEVLLKEQQRRAMLSASEEG